MKIYNLTEEFGNVKCDIKNCNEETNTYILSEYENSILIRKEPYEISLQILEEKLGISICKLHLDKLHIIKEDKKPNIRKIVNQLNKRKKHLLNNNKKDK